MQTLTKQLFRFGLVGGLACCVHWLTVVSMVEMFTLQPLVANIFGYLCGFSVSYQGHSNWTFNARAQPRSKTLSRFAVVASLGFLVNETLFFLFSYIMQMNYIVGLTLSLALTACSTFILSRMWAFAKV